MITVIRLVDVYSKRLTFRNWRFRREEALYTLWLYLGELVDEIDGPSYDEQWLAENAIPLRGEWRDFAESQRIAQGIVDKITALGHDAAVNDIVND